MKVRYSFPAISISMKTFEEIVVEGLVSRNKTTLDRSPTPFFNFLVGPDVAADRRPGQL